MGSWDDEESEEEVAPTKTAPAPAKRFAGEDEEEDVADDWEASSDEEEAPAPVARVSAPRKKGTLKAAIAAKEAARLAAAEEEEDSDEEVSEAEQKRRDKQHELDSDMLNAASLLGGTSLKGRSEKIEGISNLNPKTKEEFQLLSDRLMELITRHQDKPLYPMFVEMHVKALAGPLRDVDVRKAASALTTLANEKQKEQRDKASGKKKPKTAAKPGLSGLKASTRLDTNSYNEALDDFGGDDFM
ncbi:translation initiation factor eIF3 subunit [Clavulina sp. PMI_390]|nr:translation initiation factor eIF3 subunit [Clavulina sp. PMI_390]